MLLFNQIPDLQTIFDSLKKDHGSIISFVYGALADASAISVSKRRVEGHGRLQEFVLPNSTTGPMYILRWEEKNSSGPSVDLGCFSGSDSSAVSGDSETFSGSGSSVISGTSGSSFSDRSSLLSIGSNKHASNLNSLCLEPARMMAPLSFQNADPPNTSVVPVSALKSSTTVSALKTKNNSSKPAVPSRPARRVGFHVPSDITKTDHARTGAASLLSDTIKESASTPLPKPSALALVVKVPSRLPPFPPISAAASSSEALDLDSGSNIILPSPEDLEAIAAAHEGHKLYSTPREGDALHSNHHQHHHHHDKQQQLHPNNQKEHVLHSHQHQVSLLETLPSHHDLPHTVNKVYSSKVLRQHDDDQHHHSELPLIHSHSHIKSPRKISSSGSVASGRSGMSSTRGGASVSAVLRNMLETSGTSLEPSLIALRRSLIFIFLATALMNLVSLITVRIQFNNLLHNIDTTAQHGDLAMGLQHLFSAVQKLAFASEGLYPLANFAEESALRLELSNAIKEFSDIHYALYQEQGNGFASVDEHNLYSNAAVIVSDLRPDSYISDASFVTTNRTVNLLNAGVELVSQATVVLNLPLANLTHANVYVFWILYNGAGYRHPHDFLLVPLSTTFADNRSSNTTYVVSIVSWTVMAVALFLFTSVAAIILTRVRGVLQNKVDIFDVFLSVPPVVVRSLRLSTGFKLDNALRSKAADDGGHAFDDDDDLAQEAVIQEDDVDIDWDNFAVLLQATAKAPVQIDSEAATTSKSFAKSSNFFESPITTSSFCTSLSSSFCLSYLHSLSTGYKNHPTENSAKAPSLPHNPGSTKNLKSAAETRRKMERRLVNHPSCAMTAKILLPLLLPILLMVSYYAGRTYWTLSNNDLLSQAKAEAMAAKMVEFSVAQLGFFTRDLVTSCIPTRIKYYAGHMQQDITYSRITNDRLLYGDDGMKVPANTMDCPWTGCPPKKPFRPALRVHPEINSLYLLDGCTMPQLKVPVSTCRAYFNGMLSNGVEGIFQQLMVIVQQLVTERASYGISMASNSALRASCKPTNLRNDPDPRINLIQQFVEVYMSASFNRNSEIHRLSIEKTVQDFLQLDIIFTSLSVTALIFVYLLLYKPYLDKLNTETKAVRSLLLLFPDELSSNLGSLKELLLSGGRATFSAEKK